MVKMCAHALQVPTERTKSLAALVATVHYRGHATGRIQEAVETWRYGLKRPDYGLCPILDNLCIMHFFRSFELDAVANLRTQRVFLDSRRWPCRSHGGRYGVIVYDSSRVDKLTAFASLFMGR